MPQQTIDFGHLTDTHLRRVSTHPRQRERRRLPSLLVRRPLRGRRRQRFLPRLQVPLVLAGSGAKRWGRGSNACCLGIDGVRAEVTRIWQLLRMEACSCAGTTTCPRRSLWTRTSATWAKRPAPRFSPKETPHRRKQAFVRP